MLVVLGSKCALTHNCCCHVLTTQVFKGVHIKGVSLSLPTSRQNGDHLSPVFGQRGPLSSFLTQPQGKRRQDVSLLLHVLSTRFPCCSALVLFLATSFPTLLLVLSVAVGGILMALVLCPDSSCFPKPYGHPDVTICLNHPFCSCLNILIDLMSYVRDL